MLIAMAVVISSIHICEDKTFAVGAKDLIETVDSATKELRDTGEEFVDDYISKLMNGTSAGNWFNAIVTDRLNWDYFHKAVQKDIVDRNDDSSYMTERIIKYVERKGEKNGLGRVDIAYVAGNEETYWEVKPLSYSKPHLRAKAVKQLKEYVDSVNKYENDVTAIQGSLSVGTVTEGVIERHMRVVHTGYTENVKYMIYYWVYSDGIILYRFVRESEGKEPNEEDVTEEEEAALRRFKHLASAAAMLCPDGTETEGTITTHGSLVPHTHETDDESEEEGTRNFPPNGIHLDDSENAVYITIDYGVIEYVQGLVQHADELIILHTEINSDPDLNNSLSTSIILACQAFKIKVAGLLHKIRIATAAVGATAGSYICYCEQCYADELDEAISDFELALETYVDDEETEELQKAVEEGDEEAAKEIIGDMQSNADDYNGASECPPKDPLIIDLGQEGVELTTIENGVNFDLDCNGFSERTVWIDTEDGFLAFDRNNNGKIDNGKELFGDGVELSDGRISENGFEVLAELDSNNDGIVDCNDDEFNKLLIWIDYNHNGISESNEIITAQEKGVVSINLSYDTQVDEDNTTILKMSDIADVTINIDGEEQITHLIEYWFEVNPANTLSNNKMTTGNIPNLEKAIIEDDELFNLVMEFYMSKNVQMKRYLVKSILYHLADADDIAPNSRGGNMNARDLKVVEAFMGRPFVGYNNNKNPNSNAAVILKKIYKNLEDDYYILLNTGTIIRDYCNMICEYVDDDGNKVYDMSILFVAIDLLVCQEYDLKSAIFDIGMYLNYSDKKIIPIFLKSIRNTILQYLKSMKKCLRKSE